LVCGAVFHGLECRFDARCAVSPLLVGTAIHDIVITPSPPIRSVPWFSSSVRQGRRLRGEAGHRGDGAGLFPSHRCPDGGGWQSDRSAFGHRPTPAKPEITWKDEFRAPLGELVALAATNCQAAAFLRIRPRPYWTTPVKGEMVLGDLRFDRNPGLDFRRAHATRPVTCPKRPGWRPPRSDLHLRFNEMSTRCTRSTRRDQRPMVGGGGIGPAISRSATHGDEVLVLPPTTDDLSADIGNPASVLCDRYHERRTARVRRRMVG